MLDLQTQTDEKAVIGRLHQQVFCNFKCSGKFIQFLFPGDLSAEEGHNEPSKDKKARTKSQQSGGSALQGKQTVRQKKCGFLFLVNPHSFHWSSYLQLFVTNKRCGIKIKPKRKMCFQRCDELEQQGRRVRTDTQTRVRSLLKVRSWIQRQTHVV